MATKQKEIPNIDLSVTSKKQFTIDGDADRVIELNTSDISILSRLKESYPKLEELGNRAASVSDENTDDIIDVLNKTDAEIREILDYIFDSKIADKCAPSGTMYDMFNGEFRFEHIMNKLIALYENNLDKEYKLMTKKIKKHTDKYIGK